MGTSIIAFFLILHDVCVSAWVQVQRTLLRRESAFAALQQDPLLLPHLRQVAATEQMVPRLSGMLYSVPCSGLAKMRERWRCRIVALHVGHDFIPLFDISLIIPPLEFGRALRARPLGVPRPKVQGAALRGFRRRVSTHFTRAGDALPHTALYFISTSEFFPPLSLLT